MQARCRESQPVAALIGGGMVVALRKATGGQIVVQFVAEVCSESQLFDQPLGSAPQATAENPVPRAALMRSTHQAAPGIESSGRVYS